MDKFLTALYFEKFELTKRESELMNSDIHTDNEDIMVRNDQSILEVRKQQSMIIRLITKYIEKIKEE